MMKTKANVNRLTAMLHNGLSYRLLGLIAVIAVALLMNSCQDTEEASEEVNENWAELFFEERLASISSDADHNKFYIGTEDGPIFVYSKDGIVKYNTPFNRIYCVKRDTINPSCYWVGTRNMGLFHCRLQGDSLVPQHSYIIPIKEDRFSVYDIAFRNDSIYLGTSHGLYSTSVKVDGLPREGIYLKELWHQDEPGKPMVVGKLCRYGNDIYFTTRYGIMMHGNNGNRIIVAAKDTVNHASFPSLWNSTNELKSIMADTLYSIQGNDISKSPIEHMCIDFVKANNNLYQVSKDSLFVEGKGRVLPSPARSECRNLIIDDSRHNQVLLVTSHHLLRIPHHYTLPTRASNHVSTSASCLDEQGNAYFLLGDKLFELKPGDTIANERCPLPPTHHPSRLTACNGKFYYVINKQLFSISGKGEKEMDFTLPDEETAIGSHGGNVYIGVRDSLVMLKDDRLMPVRLEYNENGETKQLKYPFVTVFTPSPDGSLFIATLNDGVFVGKDSLFHRIDEFSNNTTHRFIRDVACHGDTTYVLTHKGLWVHEPQSQDNSPRFIPSAGFNRLLVQGKHVIAVADFGLREFHLDSDSVSDYYQDWSFRPEMSLNCSDRMIISRSNGVLLVDNPLSELSESQHWLEFKPDWEPNDDWMLVLACAAVSLLLLFLVSWLMRRRHRRELQSKDEKLVSQKQNAQRMLDLRNRLRRQLDNINSYGLANFAAIKRQADEVLESNDIGRIEQLTTANKNLLDAAGKVRAWQQTWVDGIDRIYMPESLAQKARELKQFLKTRGKHDPIECERKIDDFLDYITGSDVSEPVRRHLEEQGTAIGELIKRAQASKLNTDGVLTAQRDSNQQLINRLEGSLTEDEMVALLREVKQLDERQSMACGVVDLGCALAAAKCDTDDDASLLGELEENMDDLRAEDPYMAHLRSRFNALGAEVEQAIMRIYQPWIDGLDVDNALHELVKTGSTTGKLFSKGDEAAITVRGGVMALLLPGVDLSTNEMKIVLDKICGKRSGDYKKEKSEVRNHLLTQGEQLQQYVDEHPSSIAQFFTQY